MFLMLKMLFFCEAALKKEKDNLDQGILSTFFSACVSVGLFSCLPVCLLICLDSTNWWKIVKKTENFVIVLLTYLHMLEKIDKLYFFLIFAF